MALFIELLVTEKLKAFFNIVLDFVSKFGVDIRIDTHENNKTMLKHLKESGFIKCGIIYIDNGTSRIAFHKII